MYVYQMHRLTVFVSKARMPEIGSSRLVMFAMMLPHRLFPFQICLTFFHSLFSNLALIKVLLGVIFTLRMQKVG